MTSDRQIQANRLNAQKSTGPLTPEGKARVRMNARRHGLTGRDIVLPNEKPEDYDAFREGILNSLDPYGEVEGYLADRIVADAWRLQRVIKIEANVYRLRYGQSRVKQATSRVSNYETSDELEMIKPSFTKMRATDPARSRTG
jgi:hypothetical protein